MSIRLLAVRRLEIDSLPSDFSLEFRQVFQEHSHNLGVEYRPRALLEHRDCLAAGSRLSVSSVFHQRVKAVGDAQDPGAYWDLIASQSIWIAFPVPPLVLMPDYRYYWIRKLDSLQNLRADNGVHFHPFKFRRRQWSWLVEYMVWYSKLPDIV